MDYVTKAASRVRLRTYSEIFREMFGVPQTGPFPVLEALEKVPDVFEGSTVEIVENDELDKGVVAQCEKNEGLGFTIKIIQRVYDGAMRGIGAYRGFILHEMAHIFMYEIGYTPILQRSFKDAPRYCRGEWQVKALTGEIAMPYEETEGMGVEEIVDKYMVSKGFARKRQRY